MDVNVRRAVQEDIPQIRALFDAGPDTGPHAWREKYPGDINFSYILETGFLSVVAVDEADAVVGFAGVNDSPTATVEQQTIPSEDWETWVHTHYDTAQKSPDLCPANTLWVTMLIAQPAYAEAAAAQILRTVAVTMNTARYFLFTVSSEVGLFSPLTRTFQRIPVKGEAPEMSLYFCFRSDVLPDLLIRKGLVEDFDDLMPLLQAGDGVLTTPPEEFYLDETLENQNENHSVLVAEDPDTRQIIGLMCMVSDMESQTHLTKHYNTEVYNKLRPMAGFERPEGGNGSLNSFLITFFFLDPDYEDRAACFLGNAFAEFPKVDYCFVHLPHTTTEHPLLQDFSYIPLKTGLTLPNGVWLLSHHSIAPLKVTTVEQRDIKTLENMLGSQSEMSHETSAKLVGLAKVTLKMETPQDEQPRSPTFTENSGLGELHCFQLSQDGVMVAFCMVRSLTSEDLHHLRGNFDLDTMICFHPSGQPDYTATKLGPDCPAERHNLSGTMKAIDVQYFYVRPAFRNRIRSFLREILRQTNTQVIFYCLTMMDEAAQSLVMELILAKPRRISELAKAPDAQAETEETELMCLHYMSKKQLSDEKTKIHARLVVIGASTTGLAAIYAWLNIPYLQIANLVLVSRDGIPLHPSSADAEQWGVDTMTWLEREYMLFRIAGKLRVIEGTMIEFERAEKYIITDNGFVEPYDHLVIAAGRQFSIPRETASRHLAKNGIFELCSQAQIHKIKQHIRESEAYEDELSNAVVYGSGLDVYSAATALTRVGLAPSRIVIVSPDDIADVDQKSAFKDTSVDFKVDRLLDQLGAKVYKNYILERTDCDEDHNLSSIYITQVVGKTDDANPDGKGDANEAPTDARSRHQRKIVEIPATMLIYCHEKDIDTQILSALNKRSIVFDGRVIVRANYRTTDPNIYAIGPIAMFSGRFGPSDEFEMYNALEVGKRFAETVLGFLGVDEFYQDDDNEMSSNPIDQNTLLDPTAAIEEAPKPKLEQMPTKLPKYTDNVTQRMQLPNDHVFFTCYTAWYHEVEQKCKYLSSSEPIMEGPGRNSYVRLSIGPNGHIECVCYFGSEEVELRSLASLVGMPESLLNIVYEYEQRKDDKGTSSLNILLYLRSKLQETLKQHSDTEVLRRKLTEYVSTEGVNDLDKDTREKLIGEAAKEGSATRRLIELEMIKFLHKNKVCTE